MSSLRFSDMWHTRPLRLPRRIPGSRATLGGVFEGIGARYRIDPLFLRIIAVVTVVYPPVLAALTLVYGIMWLSLRPVDRSTSLLTAALSSRTDTSPTPGRGKGWTGVLLFAAWALIISPFALAPSFFATLLVVAAIWTLLHGRTPVPPTNPTATTPPLADADSATIVLPERTSPEAPSDEAAATPALTAASAPVAPEAQVVPVPASPRRGLWFLLGGCAALIVAAGALLTAFFGAFGAHIFRDTPTPTSAAQVEDRYLETVGGVVVDFSELPRLDSPKEVIVESRIGPAGVILPRHNYVVTCDSRWKHSACDGERTERGGGAPLRIHVRAGLGNAWADHPDPLPASD